MWTSTFPSVLPPGQPTVAVGSTTDTTISLSWSVPSGSVVDSYVVMWKSDGNSSSSTIATTTDGSTCYIIAGLQ